MVGNHQHKSGQAIIFLMVVMVIGILAVIWSYDLHRVVNAKLRMRNAGDAAALAAARWQGYTLNMIGDLNLIQAAIIAEAEEEVDPATGEMDFVTPEEVYELMELRSRLDYVGPLAAFAVAQQAAFNNGAVPDPALSSNLFEMAQVFRDEIGWEPYPEARDDYADLLDNIAARGAAVSSYGLRLPRHPLVQEPFYGAVAQAVSSWWCPMYRYRYQLENYENFESWGKLDTEFDYRMIMDLKLDEFESIDANGEWVMPSSALPDVDDFPEEFAEYLQELPMTEESGADGFYRADDAQWHIYNNDWTKPWPKPSYYNDETGEESGRFPIYTDIKPEYNYLGAVAGISMAADVHRGILASSGNETVGLEFRSKAKVFGFLDVPDSSLTGGSLVPPHYFGFVLPCFQNVRLVHSDIGEKAINGVFYEHITKHLEPYLEGGPDACDPDCPYCRLLKAWETLDRQEGLRWLDRAYNDDQNNPCKPKVEESDAMWKQAGGGASGGT